MAKIAKRSSLRVLPHYAADRTPCRCTTHPFLGLPAVEVDQLRVLDEPPVHQLRCTVCGSMWWSDWTLDRRRVDGEFGR